MIAPDWEAVWRDACKKVGHTPTPPRPATILLDGQVVSNGLVHLDPKLPIGSYQPQDQKRLDSPMPRAVLKLLDTQQSKPIIEIHPCQIEGHSHVGLRFAESNSS